MPILTASVITTAAIVKYTAPLMITALSAAGGFVSGLLWSRSPRKKSPQNSKALGKLQQEGLQAQKQRESDVSRLAHHADEQLQGASGRHQAILSEFEVSVQSVSEHCTQQKIALAELQAIVHALEPIPGIIQKDWQRLMTQLNMQLEALSSSHTSIHQSSQALAEHAKTLGDVTLEHQSLLDQLRHEAKLDKSVVTDLKKQLQSVSQNSVKAEKMRELLNQKDQQIQTLVKLNSELRRSLMLDDKEVMVEPRMAPQKTTFF